MQQGMTAATADGGAGWRGGTPEAIAAAIRDTKRQLKAGVGNPRKAFAEVEDAIKRDVEEVLETFRREGSAVPSVDYAAIREDRVPEAAKALIRRRGAAVVRGVFPRAQAEAWNEAVGEYLARNDYYERSKALASMDKYFSTLKADRPQIFGIYWSKPQMQARQGEPLARTRAFLNHLWTHEGEGKRHFDPGRECTYADRLRRREPGDATLGLSPHMDAGSVERWIDPAYRHVYRHVFAGDWRAYDPFDGAARAETGEIPSAAVCSVFRT
jgi:hypothetical protein